jgi:hypothetical protein
MNIKLAFLAILLSQSSFAALLLEPRLILDQGSLEVASESTSYTSQGTGIDIGYMGDYFLAGITIERNTARFEDPFLGNSFNNYSQGGIGTFMGFHFYDRFRLQTTYINTSLEPSSNRSIRYFGQYFAFSLGLRIYDGLMLNVNSYNNVYTQLEDDNTGLTTGLTNNIKTRGNALYFSYIFAIQ